ncbi:unnamed protein product, partial [Brassica oleracea]
IGFVILRGKVKLKSTKVISSIFLSVLGSWESVKRVLSSAAVSPRRRLPPPFSAAAASSASLFDQMLNGSGVALAPLLGLLLTLCMMIERIKSSA